MPAGSTAHVTVDATELKPGVAIGTDAIEKEVDVRETSQLVELYAEHSELNDQEDFRVTYELCARINNGEVTDDHFPRLIAGIANHFADRRLAFNDRACVLATVLFGKDEFDVQEKKCFQKFRPVIPIAAVPVQEGMPIGLFEENDCVENSKPSTAPKFSNMSLQYAIKALRSKSDTGEAKRICTRIEHILNRTSKLALKHHGEALFSVLTDLNTPELYEEQSKALAVLMRQEDRFWRCAIKQFFGTSTDTRQFFLIYTLCLFDEISSRDERTALHREFSEAYTQYEGSFEPIVQTQVEIFVNKGLMVLTGIA